LNPFIKSKKSRINLHLPGREKPYVMAHRGNKVAFPENTMSAFRQALQDGADLIETDLHLSADDVFMCIHDGTIDRTTDGSGAVAEMSLSELKKFNAAAARPEVPPEPIPTLRDLAEILPADIGLALELKTDRFLEPATCRRLAQELEQLGLKARTVVLSFSLTRLDTLRLVAPDLPVGWITLSKIWPIWGVEMIRPFWPLLFLNPFYVYLAHSHQQIICPLDPKPDSRLWYYRFLRCDAVLTDNPAETCRLLGRQHEG
jgi:glycerophosphoryl diester phosphodiesterase